MQEIIQTALHWIELLNYWGILLGLMIEIIPSEIVLAFGGYLVSRGQISFLGAVAFGTIGGVLAQLFLYWAGRYGGRPFLERYGKYILIKKNHIDAAERWFEKFGAGVIFTARFIPVVRHAISIPAGAANMPFWHFTLLTTLAVIPWSVLFVWLGVALGEHWKDIGDIAGPYVANAAMIAVLSLAAYFFFVRRRGRNIRRT